LATSAGSVVLKFSNLAVVARSLLVLLLTVLLLLLLLLLLGADA